MGKNKMEDLWSLLMISALKLSVFISSYQISKEWLNDQKNGVSYSIK